MRALTLASQILFAEHRVSMVLSGLIFLLLVFIFLLISM